jgi:hypothetical protein
MPNEPVSKWSRASRAAKKNAAAWQVLIYIFSYGEMTGLLLLLVRSVQGHSGDTMRNMTRIGQVIAPDAKFPFILTHSTLSAHQDQICHQGVLPRSPRRERTDNFFAQADDFSEVAIPGANAEKGWMPTWKDPVKSLRMREKSDVVFTSSGEI